MSEVPKLEHFNKKTGPPLNIVSKKCFFSGSLKGTPHDRRRRTMRKKNCFAMKANGIRWRSSKTDESSPWDLNSVYVSKEFKLPWWDPT